MPDSFEKEKSAFQKHNGVSYETIHRLEKYATLLREWNKKFNLVAESTLPDIWTRHFLDSAQLAHFIPQDSHGNLFDLGSGAGFPGIVLGIMGTANITLIESIGKKADFLRYVINELHLNIKVRQERIENIKDMKANFITARALKPLKELLKLAHPLMKKNSTGIFLKGRNLEEELTESYAWWTFNHERSRSVSDPSGNVLIIRDLQPKNAITRKNSPK